MQDMMGAGKALWAEHFRKKGAILPEAVVEKQVIQPWKGRLNFNDSHAYRSIALAMSVKELRKMPMEIYFSQQGMFQGM